MDEDDEDEEEYEDEDDEESFHARVEKTMFQHSAMGKMVFFSAQTSARQVQHSVEQSLERKLGPAHNYYILYYFI